MKKLLSAAALSFAFASFASFAADPPKAAEKVADKKKAPAAEMKEMKATEVKTETKTTETKTEAKSEAAAPTAVETKSTVETKTTAPAAKPAPKK